MRTDRANRRALIGAGLCLAVLAGCDAPVTQQASAPGLALSETANTTEAQIDAVSQALRALGPGVDPKEADRAARIAVLKPLELAQEWNVVDAPLTHNFKVIHGLRPKGVCQDWANALAPVLQAEGFRTLQVHIGMANARNVKLEHVSVVMTARGQPMAEGLLLDPWRIGQGRLYVERVAQDPRYTWETLEAVRAWQADLKAGADAQS
ncbi:MULTISPECIES: hypothetical protein [unclassified Marinovum]